jgi:hypothetical protein
MPNDQVTNRGESAPVKSELEQIQVDFTRSLHA